MEEWIKVAEKNGIKKGTFISRVKKSNWSLSKAAYTPVRRRSDRKWQKLAKQNGISYDTYLNRVHNLFWTPEESATIPPMSHQSIVKKAHQDKAELTEIRHERINEDPNNLFQFTPQHVEEAKRNGICKNTFLGRIYNSGWTVDEAINTPVAKGFKRPKGYNSYLKVAKQNGISQTMFRDRVKAGWSLEKASTEERIKPTDRTREDAYWIEKALQNGVKYRTYLCRVRRGWTPEEASTTPRLARGEYLNKERAENSRKAFKEFRNLKG